MAETTPGAPPQPGGVKPIVKKAAMQRLAGQPMMKPPKKAASQVTISAPPAKF